MFQVSHAHTEICMSPLTRCRFWSFTMAIMCHRVVYASMILQQEMYFSPCELCVKCVKYGKVRNFEVHCVQSVESSENGMETQPHPP